MWSMHQTSSTLPHRTPSPDRDFANGYLVAQICQRYFPNDFTLHSFDNGLSMVRPEGPLSKPHRKFLTGACPSPTPLVKTFSHPFLHRSILPPSPPQATRRNNWGEIQRLLGRHGLSIPSSLVGDTASGQHGAATALCEHLFEMFTGKK